MTQVKTFISNYLSAVRSHYGDWKELENVLAGIDTERLEAIAAPMLTDWGIRKAVRAVQEDYASTVYETLQENCLLTLRPVSELTGDELQSIRSYVVEHVGDRGAFFFENIVGVSLADFYEQFRHELMFELRDAVSDACSAMKLKLTDI